MPDEPSPSRPASTVVGRRIADMLAANFDEPRFDALLVFDMPTGGKVAAVLVGDRREDVQALHQYLREFGGTAEHGRGEVNDTGDAN